jgi:hypothetical protein
MRECVESSTRILERRELKRERERTQERERERERKEVSRAMVHVHKALTKSPHGA